MCVGGKGKGMYYGGEGGVGRREMEMKMEMKRESIRERETGDKRKVRGRKGKCFDLR